MPKWLLWSCVVALSVLGVSAAALRAMYVRDLGTRMEPVRSEVLHAIGRKDASVGRDQDVAAFDRSYAAHPILTFVHVICGGLFLALAPLQFIARLRDRNRRLHRALGWLLVIAAMISTVCALTFGVAMPFAGFGETSIIAIAGVLLLYALMRAVAAIRRGAADVHRRWMIRAFAVALGVSVSRVVGIVLDVAASPHAPDLRTLFVAALWGGWILAIAGGEWWIRSTATAH